MSRLTSQSFCRDKEVSIATKNPWTRGFPCRDIALVSRQGTTKALDDRGCDHVHGAPDRCACALMTRIRATERTRAGAIGVATPEPGPTRLADLNRNPETLGYHYITLSKTSGSDFNLGQAHKHLQIQCNSFTKYAFNQKWHFMPFTT